MHSPPRHAKHSGINRPYAAEEIGDLPYVSIGVNPQEWGARSATTDAQIAAIRGASSWRPVVTSLAEWKGSRTQLCISAGNARGVNTRSHTCSQAVNLPSLSPSAAIPQRRLSSRTSTPPAQAALSYLTFGVGGGRSHYGSRLSKHHVQGKQREYVMGNQTASLLRRQNVARG